MESKCSLYAYKIIKPLLDYVRQLKDEVDKSQHKHREMEDLREKLIHQGVNEAKIIELKGQNEFLQKALMAAVGNNKSENCHTCEKKLTTNSKELERCTNELKRHNSSLVEKDVVIKKVKFEVTTETNNLKESELQKDELQKKYTQQEKDLGSCQTDLNNLTSCNGFGDRSGIRQVKLPGINSFNILCDNETAGPEWIVIQQRIGGSESFNRNWASYRDGFGSFDSDFFLGLEKIHRLTTSRRYELYVYMQSQKRGIKYARYDDFKVASEADAYELTSLGKFSGTSRDDQLTPHKGLKFSTFDRDNDNWKGGNCAGPYKSGWWYNECYSCNLNGVYDDNIQWEIYKEGLLMRVKMIIRPKRT